MHANPPSLPGRWESPLLAIQSGTVTYAVNHGRGQTPRQVTWVVVCIQADIGSAPGDEKPVMVPSLDNGQTQNAARICMTGNLLANNLFANVTSPGQATLTQANWRLKAYAEW